jgi:hypothetical protein
MIILLYGTERKFKQKQKSLDDLHDIPVGIGVITIARNCGANLRSHTARGIAYILCCVFSYKSEVKPSGWPASI